MLRYISGLAAALAVATPAQAQDTVDPDHIASLLRNADYPAEFFGDVSTYRQIVSRSGNYEFTVEFFDCTARKACEVLLFHTAFKKGDDPPTKAEIDAYSGRQPDGRTFLDRRGDPVVELELDLTDGFSDTEFTDSLKAWDTMLTDFAGFLAGAPAPAAPAAAAAPPEAAPATS